MGVGERSPPFVSHGRGWEDSAQTTYWSGKLAHEILTQAITVCKCIILLKDAFLNSALTTIKSPGSNSAPREPCRLGCCSSLTTKSALWTGTRQERDPNTAAL